MQRLLWRSGTCFSRPFSTMSTGANRANLIARDAREEERTVVGLGDSAVLRKELWQGICGRENARKNLQRLTRVAGSDRRLSAKEKRQLRRSGLRPTRSRTDPTELAWRMDPTVRVEQEEADRVAFPPDNPRNALSKEAIDRLLPPDQVQMQEGVGNAIVYEQTLQPAFSRDRLQQLQETQKKHLLRIRPLLYAKGSQYLERGGAPHLRPWFQPRRRSRARKVFDAVSSCLGESMAEPDYDVINGGVYYRSGLNREIDFEPGEEHFLTQEELTDRVQPVLYAFLEEVKAYLLYELASRSLPYRLGGREPCSGCCGESDPSVSERVRKGHESTRSCSNSAGLLARAACPGLCCPSVASCPGLMPGMACAACPTAISNCILGDALIPNLQRASRRRIEAVARLRLPLEF
ncbi:unnamed protein product [Amoebophrya sp. A120]|nr:unnamed protein product [Amoebophrya sp. A120]|eukprot:GSA120T00002218001.1